MAALLETAPGRVLRLREPDLGLDAVVVIDHTLFPVSAGGTRLAADVTDDEVARLARAMTWKFAVYRIPYAGSKAGIRFDGKGDRAAVLAAYKRAIEPLGDAFLTGPDLGTSPDDFLDGAGGELPLWAQTYEGLGMDDLATGRGVQAAAELALERLGRRLEGATVAIEGFGKVGAGTARAFVQAGARIVAISTLAGTLVHPAGLDVEELIALRARHGDAFVEHGPAPPAPREALFAVRCDVLVPGARLDSLTVERARRLDCAVVSPGANVPYAPGAVRVLHERGILALPDFVANAGGVHLYASAERGDDPATCLVRVAAAVGDATERVLDAAASADEPPLAAALRLAREFLEAKLG